MNGISAVSAAETVSGVGGVRPVNSNISAISRSAYAAQTAAASADTTTDFSSILTEALEEELLSQAVTATASDSLGSLTSGSYGGSGIEAILLASAATGEIGETELAIFMLSLMMQTVGDSSESSMLMNVMSLLLSQMTSGKSAADAAGTAGVPEGDGTVTPESAWIPSTPAVTSEPGERSAAALSEVIGQFSVETASRYTPYKDGKNTYCNIYVWDVTKALNCEIPHYVDPATGDAAEYGDKAGAAELDANGVCAWLEEHGERCGWQEVTAGEAQAAANEGYPVVSAWANSGGIGHVQVVCPSSNGEYDALRGPTVSQAGSKNYSRTYQSNVFSGDAMRQVKYYVHE